ncbi:MAG: ECF transporter S component [Lachnospiraceae bacterium]|nr:ECF transporter S component [Lachnospiraceae bacterium]
MKKFFSNTRMMCTGAMLAAIAAVLMFLDFPLPFLPSFYKIDFSELPVLIGAYAMGPVAGVVIEAFKILVKFIIKGTSTAGIGEVANFLMGLAFILPASIMYQVKKNKKSAITGLAIGTVACVIAGCLLNAYVLLPAYVKFSSYIPDMDSIISSGTKVNSHITGLTSFLLLATAPLNLIKCVSVSVITVLIYKPLSRIIKGNSNPNK